MSFTLPDTEFGAKAARRLRADRVAWLTSPDHDGTPQPAPVWFLWDEADLSALVYSQSTARRLRRMRDNPRASLHLNDDGEGHDFVVLTGRIVEAAEAAGADRNPAYREKYGDWMTELFGSPEEFAGAFSVPLLFRPERIRGH